MKKEVKKYPKHVCQFYGCDRKLVETIIDDEFYWNETTQMYQPNRFANAFEHTGYVQCAGCEQELERARTSKISSYIKQNHTKCEVLSLGLRVVDEITTYFRTTSELHYIPNLKDGIYPLIRPTTLELSRL